MEYRGEIENISNQTLVYLGGGSLIVVLMFVVMNIFDVPFANVLALLLLGVFVICFGSITINCMVVGQCVTLAWVWVVLGLFLILVNMILQTMIFRRR